MSLVPSVGGDAYGPNQEAVTDYLVADLRTVQMNVDKHRDHETSPRQPNPSARATAGSARLGASRSHPGSCVPVK